MQESIFRDYTIAAIAFEVGFNSLTSFNTAFKKETQKTPSTYRKETAQL
jgi:AraC-like DNA-binding protein